MDPLTFLLVTIWILLFVRAGVKSFKEHKEWNRYMDEYEAERREDNTSHNET